jgi:pentatricopeptide repeat protein
VCPVHLLCHAGCLHEAEALIELMLCAQGSGVWSLAVLAESIVI